MQVWTADGILCEILGNPRGAQSFLAWQPPGPVVARASLKLHCSTQGSAGWQPFDRNLGFFRVGPDRSAECALSDDPNAISAALQLACGLAALPLGGFVIHGAALSLDCRGVVLLAPSGGGKSTLCELSRDFGCLSDESVLVWSDRPAVAATPFRSTARASFVARTCELRAFLVLEKSPNPSYRRMDSMSGIPLLLSQAYRAPGLFDAPDLLRLAHRTSQRAPFYRFSFPKSEAAPALLQRFFDEELDR